MSMQDSPTLTVTATTRKATTLASGAYVLSLVSLSSSYAASSSAPSNTIHFFDKSDFRKIREVTAHPAGITDMKCTPRLAGFSHELLLTSGKDGTVNAWDERSTSIALQMNASTLGKTRALLSCDISSDGLTVAAGTDLQGEDASILYWDPRSPAAPLRTHSSTHSDDITTVRFSKPGQGHLPHHVLLSASSDGLICTSNAEEDDEDEAGLHVGNMGCSIAQAGWVHSPAGDPVRCWTSSDMETFGLWSGELDLLHDQDIRQPSIHRQDLTWVSDYLIGCHNTPNVLPNHDNDLIVFTGSNEGDIAMLSKSSLQESTTPWTLHRLWTNGHGEVVRSLLYDESNNIIITGGEDSKINVWSCPSLLSSPNMGEKRESEDVDMDVDDEDSSYRKKRRS